MFTAPDAHTRTERKRDRQTDREGYRVQQLL